MTHIGIPEKNIQPVITVLSTLLADEHVLYIKTRNAHWNIEDNGFFSLHNLFESQYNELAELIDDIAERIRSLGHFSPGAMGEFLKLTRLIENNVKDFSSKSLIESLTADHESIIIWLTEKQDYISSELRDVATGDFMVCLIEKHQKIAWMLRANLKK